MHSEEYQKGYNAAVEEARPFLYLALGAMRAIALNPVIMGMSARVRDHARQKRRADPLVLLQSAHAKCVVWRRQHERPQNREAYEDEKRRAEGE